MNLPSNLGAQSKASADLAVNAKFDLDTSLAAYSLMIELQVPMDLIVMQCPVVFDLIDTERTGSSVLSVTPPHLQPPSQGTDQQNKYVAVFRCQSNERRMALMLRSNEGEYGELNITVVANQEPKVAKIVKFELKPLSLHTKVHKFNTDESGRARHRIRYTGKNSSY
jgi:Bardet-Biedl syndrome 7 protein